MTSFENESSLERANTILGLDTIKEKKIIFVYCPPRVGSTSLVSSLRLSGSHIYKVLHIHDEEMLKIVGKIKDVTVMDIIQYNESLGREIFVFDIYREPLERKMSEFFGKLASYHFNAEISEIEKYSIERLSKRFNNIFPYIGEDDHFLEKYTTVFKDTPSNFDFTNKILHFQKGNIHFLKIRLRDYVDWHKILAPILKINITKIVDNKRDMLKLNDLYKMFKEEYKIPKNLYNLLVEQKSFHFYLSPEESNTYIKKLKPKICEDFKPFNEDEYRAYTFISSENQKNVDIESDHYFDEGCQCDYCQQFRAITIFRLQKGLVPTHKILHRLCYKQFQLNPSIKITPYKEETFKDSLKSKRFDEIIEAKSKAKIETEKILLSDTLNEITTHEHINLKFDDDNQEKIIIYEPEIKKEIENNSLDESIQLFKAHKQLVEAEAEKQLQIAFEIKQKTQDEINLKIQENNEKKQKDIIEDEIKSQELSYIEKINSLKISAQEKLKKATEEAIREKRENKNQKIKEIESMDFKKTALSLKKKLINEIFEMSGNNTEAISQSDNISQQNLNARESFISNTKLNRPKETSLLSSIHKKDSNSFESNQMDYINQPAPIDRNSLPRNESFNSFNSSTSLTEKFSFSNTEPNIQTNNTPKRRIYKRTDGSFVYFVKDKDTNIMKMIKTDPPFSNNVNQSMS